ncbi:MAG TPA: hypothetical protein VEJ18_02505 [Planctomycetota bacterium]|nr:hypothetical protein [Planctomycetota bacterium]
MGGRPDPRAVPETQLALASAAQALQQTAAQEAAARDGRAAARAERRRVEASQPVDAVRPASRARGPRAVEIRKRKTREEKKRADGPPAPDPRGRGRRVDVKA